jgi:hypothetical protein
MELRALTRSIISPEPVDWMEDEDFDAYERDADCAFADLQTVYARYAEHTNVLGRAHTHSPDSQVVRLLECDDSKIIGRKYGKVGVHASTPS